MNPIDMAMIIKQIVKWRLTWSIRDTGYVPKGLDKNKFISALEAAEKLQDGMCCVSCGMAGNARPSIFYWAIRERFEKCKHPKNLTWITVGAQGSRGKAPGTIEELEFPGLITRYIGGHVETAKALLKLADEGYLELHTMPQGELAWLMEAQGKGIYELTTDTAIGTFLDPRVGRGSVVSPGAKSDFIEAAGDKMTFRLPKIDAAMFNAPYADREGNIYFKHASTFTENEVAAAAAHYNGGLAMACVSDIIEKNEAEISIPAEKISHIIVNPRNEQTGSVPQRKYWPMLAVGGNVDTERAVAKLKFANTVLRITPYRGEVENALARLAASLFVREVNRGATVNIGVGLPEEVSRLIYEHGLHRDLTFTTETGVYGGLPAPGIFFGAAINPKRMESSAWMFRHYQTDLDVTLLGMLQVDSEGNLNVSNRGPRMQDYVGPGGLPNIVRGAKIIIFVGKWMANAKMAIRHGRLIIEKPGKPKFIEKVDEITFNARRALELGKRVFYVTNVGIFRLTEQGLELIQVMPGIDIRRDILDGCPAKLHAPLGAKTPLVHPGIVSGKDFKLRWPD